MAIEIIDNFRSYATKPLDSRSVKSTLADRDAIPNPERFEGLQCYVQSEGKNYQLQGGITNTHWVDLTGVKLFQPDKILYVSVGGTDHATTVAKTDMERYFATPQGALTWINANVPVAERPQWTIIVFSGFYEVDVNLNFEGVIVLERNCTLKYTGVSQGTLFEASTNFSNTIFARVIGLNKATSIIQLNNSYLCNYGTHYFENITIQGVGGTAIAGEPATLSVINTDSYSLGTNRLYPVFNNVNFIFNIHHTLFSNPDLRGGGIELKDCGSNRFFIHFTNHCGTRAVNIINYIAWHGTGKEYYIRIGSGQSPSYFQFHAKLSNVALHITHILSYNAAIKFYSENHKTILNGVNFIRNNSVNKFSIINELAPTPISIPMFNCLSTAKIGTNIINTGASDGYQEHFLNSFMDISNL